ncbi:MAG TPA: DNA topoisomerase IV subunit A [Stellaceae bacterium]|jgi:topoisomerase-4 subunit A|nr:DNA topoisomerase IV subunit A [Stellaceae bacterium]
MPPDSAAADLRDVNFADALGERYLSYALSTIVSRSLPDVRDGLKPVHRRVLYAMSQLGLAPGNGYKKSARIIGDVIGKFHPHGDVAVYEALVRLAQDFAQRYPLVDGQGNFGSVDGDGAAAMRYTESRLTAVAEAMLAGINENAVDFRPTYDGENEEPVVMPARFPNLLANGAAGIAVGMATSIPPHNIVELLDAASNLLKRPRATTIEDLVDMLPGPDFPTGGVLIEPKANIIEAYKTGRGSFRLRARWHVEEGARGTYQIVVTEIPYQVQKSQLIEKIAQLLEERKLPLLDDVQDESTEQIRMILTPKTRNVDANHLMESLFRATELEKRIPLNLNVLDAQSIPRVMDIKEALQSWLDHRREVLQRRTRFRLDAIARRLEILRGQMIVYLNIDEVIRIIREYDNAKERMIKKWKLTEMQAEAILNMRLRSLRRLEEIAIKKEIAELTGEEKDKQALIGDEKLQWKAVGGEIAELRKEYAHNPIGKRRTEIGEPPAEIEMAALEAAVEREPVTVLCSAKGWIRAAKGHGLSHGDFKYKEGDEERFVIETTTADKLLVFATNGRFYTLDAGKLPSARGHGEPVRLMIELAGEEDIVAVMAHRPGAKLLLASSDGRGFVVPADEVVAQTRNGKQALNLGTDDKGDGAKAVVCAPADGDTVAVVGDNHKLLVFPLSELPEMSRGRGVMLQRYHDGGLGDAKVIVAKEGLSWRSGERTRTETDLKDWKGARASSGRIAPRGFPQSNKFG